MPDDADSIDARVARAQEWLQEATQQLDPRVRAVLDASAQAGHDATSISDEIQGVLAAAARELQDDPASLRGGVAPVLGSGVVAEFLKNGRPDPASAVDASSSRIDERR